MKALSHTLLPRIGNSYKFIFTYFTYIVTYVAIIVFGIGCLFHSSQSYAATHIITQSAEQFSEPFLKIETNDTIKFVNLDTVNHRLVFSYKGQQDKLAMIKPGESQDVVLDKSGIYDISCANHPDMKMTVYIPFVLKISNRQ